MLRLRSILALSLLMTAARLWNCVLADGITPSELYQKSLSSDLNYSYHGRQFITTYGDDGRSVSYVTEVVHDAPDSFKITYEAPAREAGRTIIEDGSQQWTYLPKSGTLVHSRELLPLTRKQVSAKYALLNSNYVLTLDPVPTLLANRKAFKLLISPRDNGSNVTKLWIDPDTGMILRKEQYHADGQIDTVMYFSDVSITKSLGAEQFSVSNMQGLKPKIVETENPYEKAIKRADARKYFSGSAILPEQLGGFQLQSLTVLTDGLEPTLHLRYSDGLTSLSLFESQRLSKQASVIAHSRLVKLKLPTPGRALQRYSYNLLNWDNAHYNFTLVGDVRMETLAGIADSLRVSY